MIIGRLPLRLASAFAILVLLSACSAAKEGFDEGLNGRQSSDSKAESATTKPTPSDPRAAKVTQAEYGDRWPFTVPEGTVRCSGTAGAGAVTFEAGGRTYAVNGTARTQKTFPDIDPIWRDSPNGLGLKVSIGPIIDKGLSLCPK